MMVAALYLALLWAPTEAEQGNVQRIFYFHVPLAWVSFLAFFVVFVGSLIYLWRRSRWWDALAHASAEIGVVFTTLVLVTGSIWARPIWGVWWTWDPRLTTTTIMWLIYLAYLLVRSYATESSQGARFAAVLGIVGFIDVPLVALAIVWWRTLHPGPIIPQGGVDPSMLFVLFFSLATFTLFYVLLMMGRVRLRLAQDRLEELKYQRMQGD
ncbi:MAG: cytochrome c biogenesis protein CcsA [Chloroflexi bacterium]|nr:cytochrome c biogenesis protein CcsA [Chloroflexota bacterium]